MSTILKRADTRLLHPPLALSVAMLAASMNCHAQQTGAASAQALSAVVVSASRSQALLEEMPLSTTVISREDIQKSPALTLDQLLRNVPGLNFTGVPATQSDPTGQQAKMRGLGNAKVLVLLDGVPMMDPFYLTTQWFKAPLSTIDHVEVIRGGNSSLWGNMAVAGVINIVSKRARDNSGEASFSVGSRGTTDVSVSKNFVASDALSFNITADQLDSRGYQTIPDSQLWRFPSWQPADAKDTNLQFTTFFKPSRDLSGYLRVGYHVQDQDISYQFGNNLQKSPDLSASLKKRFDDGATFTGTAWAQYVNFQKYNGASCYWQAAANTKCPTFASLASPNQVNSNIVQYFTQYGSQGYHERGGSAIYSRAQEGVWQSLQLGADYRRLSATDLEYFYSAPTSLAQPQNLNSSTYGKAEQVFTGVFAQTRLVPVTPLELTLSARIDNWNNTDRIGTRTNASGTTVGGAQPDNSKSAFDPSVAARYTVSKDLTFRAAAYKAFRAPGFNNTLRTFGSPNPTIANPDLGPENLFGREIGMDYRKGPVALSATYFQYDIQDMIATYRISASQSATAPATVQAICGAGFVNCGGTSGFANFYTNNQNGRSRGLELTATWNVNPALTLDASFTRTQSILTSEAASITTPLNLQLAGIPANVANASATWRPTPKLLTYLEARYIGPFYYDTTTAGGPYEQGSSTIFNASLVYSLFRNTDLSLSVTNIADRQYSENAYTFNQPWGITLSMPRTFTAGVKVRF